MSVYAVFSAVRFVILALAVVFLVPLATHALWWQWQGGRAESWSKADWSSAGILPPAGTAPEAAVRVYAARVGRWRGIFAHHSWIVIKEARAQRYTRYDVVGWGLPLRTDAYAPDGRWFGNDPEIVLALDGERAARAIPAIREAVADYPHRSLGSYQAWPGPNSNTFAAHVVARIPKNDVPLPPTALGKDWTPPGRYLEVTPSHTGFRLSLSGYVGLTVGWVDGLEVNLLGAVAGLDWRRPALKLPGWGRIDVLPGAQDRARPPPEAEALPGGRPSA